jgi:hypothetical protein
MTAIRRTAITATILAAVLAAGISGVAVAGEKQRTQAQGTPPPNAVTAQPGDGTSQNVSTWAAVYAYQVARKCLDNILPECPSK